MEYRDYYQTLGVPRSASQGEIKKAFRKLAREHHPDLKPGDKAAEERFKDVNEANAVLGDPEKRKQYDQLGPNWEAFARSGAGAQGGQTGQAGSPFGGFGGGGNVRYEFRTSGDARGFSDFFRMFFSGEGAEAAPGRGRSRAGTATAGGFDDILSQMGIDGATGGRRAPNRPQPPATAEATAELTLEEAFTGTKRLVDVDGKRLEVSIPPGVDTGSRIKLTGKAPGGGDLVVVVRMQPHKRFTRRGADLDRELPLTLEEALLGAQVPVQTLKGRLQLTVPPGTQNGRTFRLSGQGMPRLKGGTRGDLYAKARVVLPTDLSDDARKAARKFLDLVDQPDPRPSRET